MATNVRTRAEAAQARAASVRQRADRPSQRRSSAETDEGGPRLAHVRAAATLEIRAGADSSALLDFRGHASVTETPYEMYDWYGPYTEVVSAGAFDSTLGRSGLDVPLVLGHDQMRRIARTTNDTLRLSMDEEGLLVEADLDPTDLDVQYIAPKLRSGLIDEMSFAFRITRGVWSPDYTEYRIDEVEIHRGDVAIVGYGANPYTDSGLRADPKPVSSRARALLELAIAR
jgi:Escherichia/Staphylococcus phage prohead protease